MNDALVGAAFTALSDPTRRQLVGMIAERGSVTATEVARELPITRQAVAKHLAVLSDAGLAAPARTGRETRYELRPQALAGAAAWMADVGAEWDARLDRLKAHAGGSERQPQ
jgi:ArsR family transcriptional regulator, cadmium/lead-responsive transcriptional repressor